MNSSEETTISENSNEIQIENIEAGQTLQLGITAMINVFKDTQSKELSISVTNTYDDEKYNSNEITLIAKSNLNLEMTVTSDNANNYVKANDVITYNITVTNLGNDSVNNVTLDNWVSNNVTLTRVLRDGQELSDSDYSLNIDESKNQKLLEIKEHQLSQGQTVQYTIETVANLIFGDDEATEIINTDSLKVDSLEVKTIETKHILQPNEMIADSDNNNSGDNGNNNSDGNNSSNNGDIAVGNHIISGTAWIDENENGAKDDNEKNF